MSKKAKVALIGTGGTITSIGRHPMDLQDYSIADKRMHPAQILAMFPVAAEQADVVPIDFKAVPSPQINAADWKTLVHTMDQAVQDHPDLAGIVILHGTATLEETAYALNLLSKVRIPVVLVGSQRPASGLSTDAAMNLTNAIRVAADPASVGLGVLVVLNDEIQAARDVTKTSTYRLQTFRTPDFGVLGQADADSINYYRHPVRRHAPDTEFDVRHIDQLPRVDILTSYAGADGAAVPAFIAAGAKGLVSAAMAPGYNPPEELAALQAAVKGGIPVVQSTRAGSGRIFLLHGSKAAGLIGADNLTPQKARILLMCALTVTQDPEEIAHLFSTY